DNMVSGGCRRKSITLCCRFLVLDEVRWYVWFLAVERVLRLPVVRLLGGVFWDMVDVVEILGVAALGISDVVEDVAADGVASHASGWFPVLRVHLHFVYVDLVEAADLVGGVVEAAITQL